MKATELRHLRLAAQRLVHSDRADAASVVRWMVALQAQDLPGAKWAIGLRTASPITVAEVDAAFAARTIVRSWTMRGTLHLTAAEDLRGLLAVNGASMLQSFAKRRGELGLDDKTLGKARAVAEKVLAGGKALGRTALLAAFDRAKLDAEPHRGYHMLFCLSAMGAVCQGPADGADQAYVLIDDWIEPQRARDRDDVLGELARRYFASHGPATVDDLQRWLKLPVRDAKAALAVAAPALARLVVEGTTYYLDAATADRIPREVGKTVLALPGFDELILGYADRTHTLAADHADFIVPGGNGMFISTICAGGRVVGTWKRTPKPKEIVVEAKPFAALPAAVVKGFARAAADYGRFVGKPVRVK